MTPIETERLLLRPLMLEDLEVLAGICSDPHVMRFYPEPWTREGVERFIRRMMEIQAERGHSLWGVVHREDERLVGFCGLVPQMVDGVEEIEIGYIFHADYWGRGLAPEAARAAREFAFGRLGLRRVISLVHPANTPSIRVAEKNGLRLEKEIEWRGRPCRVYAIGKEEAGAA